MCAGVGIVRDRGKCGRVEDWERRSEKNAYKKGFYETLF
jgi:hypothetical protein